MEKFSWVENYNKIVNGEIKVEYCSFLRKLILKNNLFEYKCNKCGIKEWNDLPITLEIEHKDGDRLNNSKDNLELLCPNCHSQTSTYRKNRGEKEYKNISNNDILDEFKKCNNINQMLINFGLSNSGGNYKRIQKVLEENNLKFNQIIFEPITNTNNKNKIIKPKKGKKNNYIPKINRINQIEKCKQLIIESNIDFRYKNWGTLVGKLINKSPQWSLKFVKKHLSYLLEVEKPQKKTREEIKQELIYEIKNSNIDFTNKNWRSNLSKITGKTNWYLKTFIEDNLPDIWEICYK